MLFELFDESRLVVSAGRQSRASLTKGMDEVEPIVSWRGFGFLGIEAD